MITTEAHFHKIRSVIKSELLAAEKSVFVAVAWFTDRILFDTLLSIAENGVHVQVCIIRDEINLGTTFTFNELKKYNGRFFYAPDDRMHHKFCVIDTDAVITGSFNWTAKAASGQKNENIIVTKGDTFLAQQFVKEFYSITGQLNSIISHTDVSLLLKRCKVINELILLNDDEDIQKHTKRLAQEGGDIPEVQDIVKAIQKKDYESATQKIQLLVKKYSQMQVFKDPLEEQLLFEINVLEYQIIAIENRKAEVEKIVFEYDNFYNSILGPTVKEYLWLKKKLAKILAEKEPASEEYKNKYEEAEADYKDYDRAYEATKKKTDKVNILNDKDKAILKKVYREASLLCHPDKYQNATPEVQQQAEALFKQLNEASQQQDLETVKTILQKLQNGELDKLNTAQEKLTIAKLKTTIAELTARYQSLVEQYETVTESHSYKTYTEQSDIESYFENNKHDIEEEIQKLKTQLQQHEYAQ